MEAEPRQGRSPLEDVRFARVRCDPRQSWEAVTPKRVGQESSCRMRCQKCRSSLLAKMTAVELVKVAVAMRG